MECSDPTDPDQFLLALAVRETHLDLDLLLPAGLEGELSVGLGLHTEHQGAAGLEGGERRTEQEVEVGGQETVHSQEAEDVVGGQQVQVSGTE